jgi:murein DD-endopeptidase MepM/ murein hydrolase activator NlpD
MLKKIKTIFIILIALIISGLIVFKINNEEKKDPKLLYRVYLDGKELGLIKSKTQLENYINNKQIQLKNKYKLNKVYPPIGLKIEKIMTYSNNIISSKEIYKKIENKKPFTINGYTITIKGQTTTKIYCINNKIFTKASNNVIKAFVKPNEYDNYIKNQQKEIKDYGKKIENIYIEEDTTIKKGRISTNEKIFTHENELTRYLLFGTLEEQKKYIVQVGDTIDKVAFNNSLSTEEFLVANPKFTDSTNLLYSGEQVNIGLINPKLTVVEKDYLVENKEKEYKTEIKYDSKLMVGTGYEIQAGVNGQDKVTMEILYKNGVIDNNNIKIISSEEVKPAINRIYVKGGKTFANIGDTGIWSWPTRTPYIITSPYAFRWGSFHEALDISGTGYGSPIYAANNGVVTRSARFGNCGEGIYINHNNGYYTEYCHLSKRYVQEGAVVMRGQIIGTMGSTGRSTGTHLHFGVWKGQPYISPSINPFRLFR